MNDWLEAEQRVERAQQFSESEQWAEALAELEVAISINPTNAHWHAQRGFLLEELDRPAEAARAYGRSLKLDPGDRDVALALGMVLVRQGRFARAIRVFEELARRHPDFEPAYCHRIHAYAQLGRHEQAEEMFYLAQNLDDTCPHCFFHMGESLFARLQTERAIYCWERVLDLDPGFIGVNQRIGQACRANGQGDRARDYYLRELREDPGNTDLLFELADLAIESEQFANAAAKFEQIIELEPQHVEARFALGRLWLNRGDPARALACFETVERITNGDPCLPEFEWRYGEALLRLGRSADARPYLEIAAASDPDNTMVMMLLGDALLIGDRPADAADCFRRLLAVDAGDPFAHHKLAVCLARLGRDEAAVHHCRKAIRGKPDFGAAMYDAALAHLRLGQWGQAKAMLRGARRADPDDPRVAQLLRHLWRYRLRHRLQRLWP